MRRSHSFLEIEWSNHEVIPKDDEVFFFQHQLPPLDLSIYDSMSIHQDNLDDTYNFMSMNPISSSMNILPDPIPYDQDGFMIEKYSEFGYFQDQELMLMMNSFGLPNQETYMMNSLGFSTQETCMMNNSLGFPNQRQLEIKDIKNVNNDQEEMKMCQELRKDAENKDGLNHSLRTDLSMEVLRKYFYFPITKASKELNVGLTLLKKRCREIGFGRWPHRKLMSLQKLITNVQELRKSTGNDEEAEEAIRLLEEEKLKVEENPDLPLKDVTKRLRQSCFKAKYKKRKIMAMNTAGSLTNSSTSSSTVNLQSSSSSSSCVNDGSFDEGMEDDDCCADDEEQEKMKAILFTDCSPSSSNVLF